MGIAGSSLIVRVVNSYRPTLEIFKAAFGGVVDVHHKGDDRTRLTWEWRCYGDTADHALRTLLPLLQEKACQAYLGLQFRQTLPDTEERRHIRKALAMLKKTTHFRSER